jgi:hypothetical protein
LLLAPALSLHAQQIYKSVDSEGHAVYTDHVDPSTEQTTVVLPSNAMPPDVLHFCWTNCFTLNLDNGVYRRIDGTDETWTIERFTADALILHRHDAPAVWNDNRTDVVYRGQSVEGRLLNVTVNGNPVPDVNMAWGAALHTLPGSNAERDQRRSAPAPQVAISGPPSSDGPPAAGLVMTTNIEPPPLPGVGLLWTPGYWAYEGAVYRFHPGYWGPHVGYYGGINYGFGYFGAGFVGGRWVGKTYANNRSVNHLSPNVIHKAYDEPAAPNANLSKVSYHGGPHGTTTASNPTVVANLATNARVMPTPTYRTVAHGQATPARDTTGSAPATATSAPTARGPVAPHLTKVAHPLHPN